MYKSRTLKILKIVTVSACALISLSSFALEKFNHQNYQADFSDPLAVYSNAGIGMSNDGVDIFGGVGGYLSGSFKQKLQLEAKGDLGYYNANYLAIDTNSDTGFLVDSVWSRDYFWSPKSANDSSLGVIKKVPLLAGRLDLDPILKFGYIWGGGVQNTSYVKAAVVSRFSVIQGFWVGITPSYTHGMKGYKLREWNASLDAGYIFNNGIGLLMQTVTDSHEGTQYRANATLAF